MFSSRPQGAQAKIEDKLRHNLRQKDSDSDCKSLRCTPAAPALWGRVFPPAAKVPGREALAALAQRAVGM